MRRFAPGALFSEQLAAGTLRAVDVDRLAALHADFYELASCAEAASSYANAERRRAVALAALEGVRSLASEAELAELRAWIEAKGIVPRPDKNGKSISTKSLAYLIGRKIANSGNTVFQQGPSEGVPEATVVPLRSTAPEPTARGNLAATASR